MWNITHSLVWISLYYSSGHKSWKCCATCILYINIYTVALLFILSAFIMPPEGHFGIIYDMDFFSPQHRFCLPSHVLLFFSIRTEFQYSKMGLLPLAVFNTERACFLIIFSSLRWHWFMRVMSDTPPSASTPSSTPPPSPDLQFLRFSFSERSSSFLSSPPLTYYSRFAVSHLA